MMISGQQVQEHWSEFARDNDEEVVGGTLHIECDYRLVDVIRVFM